MSQPVYNVPGTSLNPHPFRASDHADDGKKHLLLAASGSVATIKIANILSSLSRHSNLSICLILTRSAAKFLDGQSEEQPTVQSLFSHPNIKGIFLDDDEWQNPWTRGQPILHIELRRWSHLLVIAPLSANTLAKITGGLSDNLLTSVVRAWDTTGLIEGAGGKKRILVAAAMNTAMWRHPVTKSQMRILEQDWGVSTQEGGSREGDGWFEVLKPQEKELACGDVGDGAMMEWTKIVKVIEARLRLEG